MMRALTGPDNRRLMPVSLFAGAVLMVAADTLTRAVLPTEIPIGILTALIGGPFFLLHFSQTADEALKFMTNAFILGRHLLQLH